MSQETPRTPSPELQDEGLSYFFDLGPGSKPGEVTHRAMCTNLKVEIVSIAWKTLWRIIQENAAIEMMALDDNNGMR